MTITRQYHLYKKDKMLSILGIVLCVLNVISVLLTGAKTRGTKTRKYHKSLETCQQIVGKLAILLVNNYILLVHLDGYEF